MKFRVPLSTLHESLKALGEFPFGEPGSVQYKGPTLVVRGTKSPYVSDETFPAIKGFFPNSRVVDVEAGHWVISENPEAFRKGRLFQTPVSTRLEDFADTDCVYSCC
jgi:pimeloyl-ACP methyl ester carboxylesterase